jgi:hypothetical protein
VPCLRSADLLGAPGDEFCLASAKSFIVAEIRIVEDWLSLAIGRGRVGDERKRTRGSGLGRIETVCRGATASDVCKRGKVAGLF